MSEITIAPPPGVEGAGFFATKLDSIDKVVGLARSHSLWPLPFATSSSESSDHIMTHLSQTQVIQPRG